MAILHDPAPTRDQAQDALHTAMRRSDVGALADLLFEHLSFELPDGTVTGRDTDLAARAAGAVRFEDLTEIERSTLELDGHGRTSSLVDIVVLDGDERIRARVRYRRSWSIIDGRWQVLAGSAEPVG